MESYPDFLLEGLARALHGSRELLALLLVCRLWRATLGGSAAFASHLKQRYQHDLARGGRWEPILQHWDKVVGRTYRMHESYPADPILLMYEPAAGSRVPPWLAGSVTTVPTYNPWSAGSVPADPGYGAAGVRLPPWSADSVPAVPSYDAVGACFGDEHPLRVVVCSRYVHAWRSIRAVVCRHNATVPVACELACGGCNRQVREAVPAALRCGLQTACLPLCAAGACAWTQACCCSTKRPSSSRKWTEGAAWTRRCGT